MGAAADGSRRSGGGCLGARSARDGRMTGGAAEKDG